LARLLIITAVVVACLAGCKAGVGQPCREENDCSGSLICCKPTASASERGTCERSCERIDAGPGDAGMGDDSGTDAAVDAGDDAGDGGEDAGMDDAGPGDAGDEDAAPEDAGPGDADGPDAAPPDAG
jgi:hypothetical protein